MELEFDLVLMILQVLTDVGTAVAAACGAYIAWSALRQGRANGHAIDKVHACVDDRMDQLLAATKITGFAEGERSERKNGNGNGNGNGKKL